MVSKLNTFETSRTRRRGAVSIWAIVCLIFVTAVGATLGRLALMGSRHMIQERRRSQADWLVQSGWSLAVAQLQHNADYKGETWEIPAAELGGTDAGRIRIDVTPPAADTPQKPREISVVVEFPVGSDNKVHTTRQGTWLQAKP
jgi:hypothetical protein